jgi:hypothetical protein
MKERLAALFFGLFLYGITAIMIVGISILSREEATNYAFLVFALFPFIYGTGCLLAAIK